MRIYIVRSFQSFLACFGLFLLLFSTKMQAQCPAAGTMGKAGVQVFELNLACAAPIIRPNDLLTVMQTPACEGEMSLTFSLAGMPKTQPLSSALVGQNIDFLLLHPSGWFVNGKVRLQDKIKPTITVAHPTLVCGQLTQTFALPMPTVSDNCTETLYLRDSLRHTDIDSVLMPTGCANPFSRIIKRTWRTRDRAGNWGQFTQIIRVKRFVPSDIVFPQDTVHLQACVDNINNTVLTGIPLAMGVWPVPLVCSSHSHPEDTFLGVTCGKDSVWQRIWVVTKSDSCGFWEKRFTQIILFKDQTTPILQCQPDFKLPTDPVLCSATFKVPTLTAIDGCTGGITIGLLQPVGAVMGQNFTAPTGETLFKYYATDCSGDSSFCNIKVTVEDKQSPTLVCSGKPVLSINNAPLIDVPWPSLVAFTQDNCPGAPVLTVKRADQAAFLPKLTITCADAGKKIAYEIKAVDAVGNETVCEDTISIFDKLGPIFTTCPPNKTVDCLNPNIHNLTAFGTATATEPCGVSLLDYDETDDLGACGFGTITRTWTAWDFHQNSSVCTQKITVTSPVSTHFTASNIVWPENFTSFGCSGGATNLDPTALPPAASKPTFLGQFCGNPFASFHDIVYNNAAPACYKIVRKWTVIDWCVVAPTIGNGKWEFFQTVAVMDTVRPKLFLPANDTFGLNATCTAAPVTNLMASATDCSNTLTWRQMVGNVENPYATDSKSADLSGNYPPGVTTVKIFVRDGCGLETGGLVKITATDLKKPTPLCPGVLSINLSVMAIDGAPMAMVGKELFNFQSFDNCTPASQLIFKIKKWKIGQPNIPATEDALTYTCSEQGTNIVQFWATDAAGNSDFCTTLLLVQPNMVDCPPSQTPLVGQILTEKGEKVEHVAVGLTAPSLSANAMTDQNGSFSVPNLPVGAALSVLPKRNDDLTNGLSTYDLVLLSKHILGVQPLVSPYLQIAADVNHSNSISTLDIVELRKVMFGITTSMPNNESWRFVDLGYQFQNPTNPLLEPFPEKKEFGQLAFNAAANFIGIKIGDLNGSAAANDGFSEVDDRGNDDELVFFTTDFGFEKGQTVAVPVRVEAFENILGLQGTFEFDSKKLRLADVHFSKKLPAFSMQNLGYARVDEGLLALSFDAANGSNLADGETLIELIFETLEKGKMGASLTFSDQILRAEAYEKGENSQGPGHDKRRRPTLAFLKNEGENEPKNEDGKMAETAILKVAQNRPNPFSEATEIAFEITQVADNEQVTLRIFDLTGREVFSKSQNTNNGKGQFRVEKIDLPNGSSGAFFYRVETEKWAETRRMILQ